MRVLFNTNVVLNILIDRKPFPIVASLLFSEVEKDNIKGFLCVTTIITIHYLVSKSRGKEIAAESINLLLNLFEIASVNRAVLITAKNLNFKDFEDAVIYSSAIHSGCNAVVTRNTKDFISTDMPVFLPDELIRSLNQTNRNA